MVERLSIFDRLVVVLKQEFSNFMILYDLFYPVQFIKRSILPRFDLCIKQAITIKLLKSNCYVRIHFRIIGVVVDVAAVFSGDGVS